MSIDLATVGAIGGISVRLQMPLFGLCGMMMRGKRSHLTIHHAHAQRSFSIARTIEAPACHKIVQLPLPFTGRPPCYCLPRCSH
jgi:hypothetical protein